MDVWQEHIYNDCAGFVGSEFKHRPDEVTISLSQREAYVVMKAFEDQQRYLHLTATVENKDEEE